MVVVSELMPIACMFLYVVALVGNIMMVKGVSKLSVENGFNHRSYGFYVNIGFSRVSKTCYIVISK